MTQAGHIDTGLTTTYLMYKYFSDTASGFGGHEDLACEYTSNPSLLVMPGVFSDRLLFTADTLTTARGHPGYLDMLRNGSQTTFNENWVSS